MNHPHNLILFQIPQQFLKKLNKGAFKIQSQISLNL